MVSKQRKPLQFTTSILLNFTLLLLSSNSNTASHYTDFVYKKCRNETHISKNLVSSLIQELVEKSSKSKFYQTSTGDDTFAVSGMFQCRRDLTNNNCHDCIVNTLPILSCGSDLLARVQLKGCYISLEPEPDIPDSDIDNRVLIGVQKDNLQHKECGERRRVFEGLEEVKDAAFEAIARCVMSSGDGHCAMSHEWIHVVAQCEMSMEECQCGECVSNAFQVAQDECWESDSGEVYLANCFVSFSDNQPIEGGGNFSQDNNIGGGSAKVVALVVGIGVALAILSAFCYCIRSSRRKRDDL